jgi:hypothetical protein
VPAWLSSWLPPPAAWSMLAAIAGVIAVGETVTTAVIKRLLPRFGITRDSLRWTLIEGPIELLVLGVVIGLTYLLGPT